MINLLLAISCSFIMSLFLRLYGKDIKNPMAMYMSNYVMCIVLSLLFVGKLNLHQKGMGSPLLLGLISGALYLISLAAYNSNLNKNGLAMAATFNKLGILVPTLMAIVVFKEAFRLPQLIGFIMAIVCVVLLYYDKDSMKQIQNKGMLIYLLFAAGICDSMSNIYENVGVSELKNYFLLFNFCFACLFALITLLVKREKSTKKDYLVGLLVGIPNYLSSRFALYALSTLPAVLVYPVYSVSVLVLLNVTGILFFKEEINLKKGLILSCICIALALLNF